MYRFFQDVEADSERTVRETKATPITALQRTPTGREVYGDMEDDSVSLRPAPRALS